MIYATLICLAVVFARHAPADERRSIVVLAMLVAADWVFCGLAYSANPPHRWVGATAPDLWALADALLGAATLGVSNRWWAWSVWAATTIQVLFHIFHNLLPDPTYTFWLDRLLDAQIAVFLLIGGRGVADRMLGIFAFLRMGFPSKGDAAEAATP